LNSLSVVYKETGKGGKREYHGKNEKEETGEAKIEERIRV
jgi:hypothetical protein